MRLPCASATRHLTYCSNVHPGESWSDVRDQVLPRIVEIKSRVCPDRPFGVGLRLSAQAARTLREPCALAELRSILASHQLYVFTLNGFPYGNFHAAPVKEHVYAPDQRSELRLAYSIDLAELLAALLPEQLTYGSISTVPFGLRSDFVEPLAWREATDMLMRLTAHLSTIEQRTGRRIVLALEPEPHCALETSADCVEAFERHLRGERALRLLAAASGCAPAQARALVDRYLGVCVDACHAAVEFETAQGLLDALEGAGIGIFKVQLSAGVIADGRQSAQRTALQELAEDAYLHQVVVRCGDKLTRYLDLPQALAAPLPQERGEEEWRVHFHVPIHAEQLGCLRSTRAMLAELCCALRARTKCDHFEVETYTWGVLPPALRGASLTDDIVRELQWVMEHSGLVRDEVARSVKVAT